MPYCGSQNKPSLAKKKKKKDNDEKYLIHNKYKCRINKTRQASCRWTAIIDTTCITETSMVRDL